MVKSSLGICLEHFPLWVAYRPEFRSCLPRNYNWSRKWLIFQIARNSVLDADIAGKFPLFLSGAAGASRNGRRGAHSPLSREPPSESSVDLFSYTKEPPDFRSIVLDLRLSDKDGRPIIVDGSASQLAPDGARKRRGRRKMGRLPKLGPSNSLKGNVCVCAGSV